MRTITCAVLALLLLLLTGPGCILEEKVVEVVLTGETCVVFEEYHESAQFTTPVTLNYADSIRRILEENDIDMSKIKEVSLVSASYEVVEFDHQHDWTISGFITVQRDAGEAKTLVEYTSQSVQAALKNKTYADLGAAGVAIINGALASFLDDPYLPILLTFEVNNGSVVQEPSGADPLAFTWRACIQLQVAYEEKFEVPDPL